MIRTFASDGVLRLRMASVATIPTPAKARIGNVKSIGVGTSVGIVSVGVSVVDEVGVVSVIVVGSRTRPDSANVLWG